MTLCKDVGLPLQSRVKDLNNCWTNSDFSRCRCVRIIHMDETKTACVIIHCWFVLAEAFVVLLSGKSGDILSTVP